MVPTDTTSPKPPHRMGIGRKKRILYILLPLLLINAGISRVLINQIDIKASADSSIVMDETTTISSVDNETSQNSAIAAITPPEDQPVITTYIVQNGDTLTGIASKFNISVNTIRWANDMTPKTVLKTGMELVILPVTGIEYTVKKGDTLSGIAVKFDASQAEILYYNDIEESALKVGTKIIIPEAEPLPVAKAPVAKTTPKPVAKTVAKVETTTTSNEEKNNDEPKAKVRFTNPVPGAVLTQRIHDTNAVDFGLPVGSPVLASAAGKVIIARSGYNGGYGTMIVISHPDGSQTLYAHLSKLRVSVGENVSQGERIGDSGNTGRSTGPHLHYLEKGTGKKNTFANLPLH